jgi:DNA invertase Pin-like site-specific DNA recombinase
MQGLATKSMKIGYARVATQNQKVELQLKALKNAGYQKIFRKSPITRDVLNTMETLADVVVLMQLTAI